MSAMKASQSTPSLRAASATPGKSLALVETSIRSSDVSTSAKSNNQESTDTDGKLESNLLEEYNFFAKRKQEVLLEQQAEKRKLDAHRRKAKREEALKWRAGGKEALKTVTSRVHEIRFMLKPHHYMRQCMGKLSGYQMLVPELKLLAQRHDRGIGDAHYLLEVSRRERYPLHSRHSARVTVMQQKVAVTRSVQIHHQEHHPFDHYTPEAFALRHRYAAELKLYRFLTRYFAQRVQIPTEMRLKLAKKRQLLQQARAKLQLIHDTQGKCAKIHMCKSRQHYNPKGCSNCGVIFMGGSLQGAIAYVKSLSRDTGVATLVTLEFEESLLREEERIQVGIVHERQEDLYVYEQQTVYLLVAQQLQPWWTSVILYKRHLRRLMAINHSRFYHRIRRLVALKRDVDVWILAPQPIDCHQHGQQGKYVDLIPELEEYVALQSYYKRLRIEKYARQFQRKLHTLLDEARERKYQEWLRQQALLNAPKPIVIKTLAPTEASIPRQHEHYRCYRAGCCRRLYQNPYHANMDAKSKVSIAAFLTKDRYVIHVRSHQAEDEQRRLILDEHLRLGKLRQRATVTFLRQLQQVRAYLLEEMHAAIRPHHVMMTTDATDGENGAAIAAFPSLLSSHSGGVPPQPSSVASRSRVDVKLSIDGEILSWANEDVILREKEAIVANEAKKKQLAAGVTLPPGLSDLWTDGFQESLGSLPVVKSTHADVKTTESPEKYERHRPFSLFHHSYQLLHLFHPGPALSLKLVSKHSSVSGPSLIPLDRYLMRVGTSTACEMRLALSGMTAIEKRVEDIHCLLYIQDEESPTRSLSTPAGDAAAEDYEPTLVVKVVDNYSRFGTYLVGEGGAKKVSTRLAQGSRLTPGSLLCIGVQVDGPPVLSVADASLACLVYQFHIEGALHV
eukprot:gene7682-5521_t